MGIIASLFGSASSKDGQPNGVSAGSEADTSDLALYHFTTCPFCVRVRRAVKKMGLPLELRNIHKSAEHRTELAQGGGSTQVPCLRIDSDGDVRWLYESADIVDYLQERFA